MAQTQAGLNLIELIIAIAIISMLLAMGAPAFNLWIQNTQTRTAAESILNGMQIARQEAVRRNTKVRFNLTDAAGGVAWSVDCVTVTSTCPAGIQSRSGSEGGSNARAGTGTVTGTLAVPLTAGAGLPAGVTFDGFGRVPSANVGTDIARVDVTNAANSSARRMVILVSTGGQTRMCDPVVPLASNPQGCI
ncbi:MAG: GspH/FimT family protein [Gallionella sp.]|jgi:type IV fimbrial biogenesis protein FimT|nr:GspH/FimT family protein [Gallionella sp.]